MVALGFDQGDGIMKETGGALTLDEAAFYVDTVLAAVEAERACK